MKYFFDFPKLGPRPHFPCICWMEAKSSWLWLGLPGALSATAVWKLKQLSFWDKSNGLLIRFFFWTFLLPLTTMIILLLLAPLSFKGYVGQYYARILKTNIPMSLLLHITHLFWLLAVHKGRLCPDITFHSLPDFILLYACSRHIPLIKTSNWVSVSGNQISL